MWSIDLDCIPFFSNNEADHNVVIGGGRYRTDCYALVIGDSAKKEKKLNFSL